VQGRLQENEPRIVNQQLPQDYTKVEAPGASGKERTSCCRLPFHAEGERLAPIAAGHVALSHGAMNDARNYLASRAYSQVIPGNSREEYDVPRRIVKVWSPLQNHRKVTDGSAQLCRPQRSQEGACALTEEAWGAQALVSRALRGVCVPRVLPFWRDTGRRLWWASSTRVPLRGAYLPAATRQGDCVWGTPGR
jgi:hypothetical protein